MDFTYPPEAEKFREELRSWLSEHLTDRIIEAGASSGSDAAAFETMRAWNATMADDRWSAVSWPQEYGGRGASVLQQLVYVEETVRARVPLPLNIIGINNIAPAIMEFGTAEQKGRYLTRMLRADDIWCQGMSEPESGSDLASLRTRAVRDGDDYVIDGQKIWTSLGHRAQWCQLYARTDPDAPKHKGITCFLVDMSTPGIDARPLVTLNGSADFAEVFFDGVRVPATSMLGPLNQGWRVATATLAYERAAAARLYTEMQVKLGDLVRGLADVTVSGVPALEDSATIQRVGELAVRIANLEVLCQRSVSAAVHGGDAFGTAGLAKTVWGEVGQDLSAFAYDVLGDEPEGKHGRTWSEYRLTSRALTIAGGTTQITKNITAQRVLGLPRS